MREIHLQFTPYQWQCLEPYLDGLASDVGVHDHILDFDPQGPPPMIRCDEDCYERVLAVSKRHCPDLVPHIENQKEISLLRKS